MRYLAGAVAALVVSLAYRLWGDFLWRWLFSINDRANERRTMKGNAA